MYVLINVHVHVTVLEIVFKLRSYIKCFRSEDGCERPSILALGTPGRAGREEAGMPDTCIPYWEGQVDGAGAQATL